MSNASRPRAASYPLLYDRVPRHPPVGNLMCQNHKKNDKLFAPAHSLRHVRGWPICRSRPPPVFALRLFQPLVAGIVACSRSKIRARIRRERASSLRRASHLSDLATLRKLGFCRARHDTRASQAELDSCELTILVFMSTSTPFSSLGLGPPRLCCSSPGTGLLKSCLLVVLELHACFYHARLRIMKLQLIVDLATSPPVWVLYMYVSARYQIYHLPPPSPSPSLSFRCRFMFKRVVSNNSKPPLLCTPCLKPFLITLPRQRKRWMN